MKNHTTIPWQASPAGVNMREKYTQSHAVYSGTSQLVAGFFSDVKGGEEQAKANAELVVRCVNSHGTLVALLESALPVLEDAVWEAKHRAEKDPKFSKVASAFQSQILEIKTAIANS